MCTVWRVDKYKITFKLYQFQENLSQHDIIDARAWYRAAARRLRNTELHRCLELFRFCKCFDSSRKIG